MGTWSLATVTTVDTGLDAFNYSPRKMPCPQHFFSTKRRSQCSLAPGGTCKSRNFPFCSFFPETASVEDVIKYLDPQYIDRMAIPDAMKLQFILAEEQFILSQAALLEQVSNLQPFLDSAHIKAVPEHATKLQRLSQIHIQQQDQCEAVTENVKALLEDYNKMTVLLSKQFVQWDEILTQLEMAKQVKPVAE
ncbi:dynactin subunit 3 [Alligator sinensis]|uniref:Dynactin subunit 3 n=1 Tax=Alligator sinensis TaxID=38654 RepID=A0A3Q0GYL9_ALLSI|nr:dynactin subunit 3 [Alligator sinensis]